MVDIIDAELFSWGFITTDFPAVVVLTVVTESTPHLIQNVDFCLILQKWHLLLVVAPDGVPSSDDYGGKSGKVDRNPIGNVFSGARLARKDSNCW